MEDEVVEKYFERIENFYYPYVEDTFDFIYDKKDKRIRKQKLKEILEEIEHKNYVEGYDACEKDNAERG